MAEIIAEWAGKDRLFRLTFGGILDLEEALGDAIGAVFLRVSSGRFYVKDIYHIIRLSLIGGGLNKVEAKHLIEDRFDTYPLSENAALAGEVLLALMVGVEDFSSRDNADAASQIKFSEVAQICQTFNMSPHDLRALTYADFINLVRGFNAANPDKRAPHISEEEFEEILAKYEPEALNV